MLAAQAPPGRLRVVRRIAIEEEIADVELDRDPRLAVGVHLRPRRVVADVGEVEWVDVRVLPGLREAAAHRPAHVVVADALDRVPGDVRALDERALLAVAGNDVRL